MSKTSTAQKVPVLKEWLEQKFKEGYKIPPKKKKQEDEEEEKLNIFFSNFNEFENY
jgi:hypothetical protein